ncbi:MAG TPA: Holliday junction resolvase-like protein [Treponemataceae bacterium]|nr:Holliday junction resolvase-like protein [Treponemataceae bacterium]
MSANLPLAFVLTIAALAGIIVLFVGVKIGMYVGKVRAERAAEARIELERLDAVKRSRAVLGGQFSEQLSPFLPGFPGDPTEVRFIGKPVDFISFSGSSRGAVDEVLFIEVKSGDSRQSAVERSLRKAIERGSVRYVEYRVPARRSGSGE